MLGESVVGIKHVIDPRGGKIAVATHVLFAAGAAALLMAAIAFAAGVDNAQYNDDAKAEYLAEGKPLSELRPRRLTLAYDFMAFGGLAAGMACLTVGLARFRKERVDPRVRIGTGDDVDFAVDGAPSESFPLVAPVGDDFLFNFFPTMDGEMVIDGKVTPLSELSGHGLARPSRWVAGGLEARFADGARFRVRTGMTTFWASAAPRPRALPVPLFATIDRAVLPYLAGSAALLLGILLVAWWGLASGDTLALDLMGGQDRLSSIDASAFEDPMRQSPTDGRSAIEAGGSGTRRAGAEGKLGDDQATAKAGRFAMEQTDTTAHVARAHAIDQARQGGFLGEGSALSGAAFASLSATADFSSGLDPRNVYGGNVGVDVGVMYGSIFAAGVQGVGPGANGLGWDTIGAGNYRTIGHGDEVGSGDGTGPGDGLRMHGHRSRVPKPRIGTPSIVGDLDRNIIRRHIRRKLAQITYCYEKQLMVHPGLHGTVVTQFQISPVGTVLHMAATGLGESAVASCVGEVLATLRFPRPRGGGIVNVRYPFTFQPAPGTR